MVSPCSIPDVTNVTRDVGYSSRDIVGLIAYYDRQYANLFETGTISPGGCPHVHVYWAGTCPLRPATVAAQQLEINRRIGLTCPRINTLARGNKVRGKSRA
jgi:hypothetical protein